jgi:hypothetical protein
LILFRFSYWCFTSSIFWIGLHCDIWAQTGLHLIASLINFRCLINDTISILFACLIYHTFIDYCTCLHLRIHSCFWICLYWYVSFAKLMCWIRFIIHRLWILYFSKLHFYCFCWSSWFRSFLWRTIMTFLFAFTI